jgi:hypothetical protein
MSVTSRWLILLVEKTEETGVKRRAAARKCRFHCTDYTTMAEYKYFVVFLMTMFLKNAIDIDTY